MTPSTAFGAGVAAMSFLEYGFHRFEGHEAKQKTQFTRGHMQHHAEKDWFIPMRRKVEKALPITVGVAAGSRLLLRPGAVAAFTGGMMGAYVFFELFHRRLHTHAPQTAYGRWARKHHFHHHFNNPRKNHGITVPMWDHLMGTAETADKVRVPRRHAMDWLVDDNGEVKPEYQDDYELRGARWANDKPLEAQRAADDMAAALASCPPA